MSGILKITDGTNSVTLLTNLSGVFVEEWRPQSSQPKGGGVWAESPFADGRQLVLRNRQNVIDTFNNVKLMGGDQDIAIANSKTLIGLFEKAIDYWVEDWQYGTPGMPVWIEYRGECETNTSYAYIYDYSWPELSNPHDNPFRKGIADELTLILEHGEWRDNAPFDATAVSIYSTDGTHGTLAADASTDYGVHFFAPYYDATNLSHVYLWDQSAGAFWGGNVVNTYPQDLFVTPVQVNDAIYYGSDTPFGNFVHTLSQRGQTNSLQADLEYWNGAAWVAVSTDSSNAPNALDYYPSFIFNDATQTGGTFIRTFGRLGGWAKTVVNGTNKYWVRERVTALVAQVTVPIQVTRGIYSVKWPWIEIADTEIEGDLPALIRSFVRNYDHNQDNAGLPSPGGGDGYVRKLILASRSVSRGSTFTSYINMNSTADPLSPNGFVLPYAPGGASAEASIFNNTISPAEDWLGEYRVIVRYVFVSGSAVSLRFAAGLNYSGTQFSTSTTGTYQTDTTALAGENWQRQIDLGTIKVSNPSIYSSSSLEVDLYASTSAAASIKIIDVVLIPIDEMAVEMEYIGGLSNVYMSYGIGENVLDSTLEKEGANTIWTDGVGGLWGQVRTRAIKAPALKPDTHTKLFVYDGYGSGIARVDAVFATKLYAVQRYIFARGDE